MKHKKIVSNRIIASLAIAGLTASSCLLAANYDVLSAPKSQFDTIKNDATSVQNTSGSGSILDSLQKSQIDVRRDGYQSVINLIQQGKFSEAQAKNAALLKEYPKEAEFYNLQAALDAQNKDLDAAKKNYEKALTLNQNSVLARIGMARLAVDAGQLDVAKDHINKLLAVNDKVIPAYLLLAEIAARQKDEAEVEKMLLKGHEHAKGAVDIEIEMLSRLGQFYTAQKKVEKMLSLTADLTKRYPNNSNAANFSAQSQIANNKKAEAYTALKKFVADNKQDVANRLLLAKLLMERSDKEDEAMTLLDESIKIAPDKADASILKAAYLVKLKRNAEAIALTDKLLIQFPKLMQIKMLKAELYLADKKIDEALDIYQKIYKESPNNNGILFTIVDLLTSQNKTTEAVKLLDANLAKNPKDLAAHFKLGLLYQQQNDYQQAEKHYAAILDQQPDNVLALNNLALIYSLQNDVKAVELAKKAYDKAHESAVIIDTYGYILVKQGDAKEGLSLLEKAAKLEPKINDIQFHLADAYAVNGDSKKAIAILETLAKVEENFSEKKAATELLNKLKAQ